MKLIEAQTRIEKIAHVPFKDYLYANEIEDAMMKIPINAAGPENL